MEFLGLLSFLDVTSDVAPRGARGHRVVLTKQATLEAVSTLLEAPVKMKQSLDDHIKAEEIGVIKKAWIDGNQLWISGNIVENEMSKTLAKIEASAEPLGMSYEI